MTVMEGVYNVEEGGSVVGPMSWRQVHGTFALAITVEAVQQSKDPDSGMAATATEIETRHSD